MNTDIGSSNPATCQSCGVWMPRVRTWHRGKACCRSCLGRIVNTSDVSTGWMKDANCAGSGVDFYPDFGPKTDTSVLRLICRSCQVSTECLTYAISTREPHGMWGGMTPMERYVLASRNNLPVWYVPEGRNN